MAQPAYEAFVSDAADVLGSTWVTTDDGSLSRYGRSELASGPRPPVAVVSPKSVDQVRELVVLANRHKVPLYPVSAGRNVGLGQMTTPEPGNVLMHLGRMNRILDYHPELGFVAVEPGVTYQGLADFLLAEGDVHMIDPTTGPPDGSVLANVLEKGGGATMAGDHVAHACGLEVVLGDGRVVRTGDGALPTARTWHLSKLGFGPVLDGLFLQSNFGIVTRMGMWLATRPTAVRCEFLIYPNDDDLGAIIQAARPLLQRGRVNSAFKITSGLYALASQTGLPDHVDRRQSLPRAVRIQLQELFGVGAWLVTFASYGDDPDEVAARSNRIVADLLTHTGPANRISQAEASANPIMRTQISVYSGTPTDGELGLVNWRGGGIISLTPAVPMIGHIVDELADMSRSILDRAGLEFSAAYVCSPRLARALHSILFDPTNPDECRRADWAAREICDVYAQLGWPISRAPVDLQQREMRKRPDFLNLCLDLRDTLDPNGIIAPGRYGLTRDVG